MLKTVIYSGNVKQYLSWSIGRGVGLGALFSFSFLLGIASPAIRHFPRDGGVSWFLFGVFSLWLLFALQSCLHGAAAGAAAGLRSLQASPANSARDVTVCTFLGSLAVSVFEYGLLTLLFPIRSAHIAVIVAVIALSYALFFAFMFGYWPYRSSQLSHS